MNRHYMPPPPASAKPKQGAHRQTNSLKIDSKMKQLNEEIESEGISLPNHVSPRTGSGGMRNTTRPSNFRAFKYGFGESREQVPRHQKPSTFLAAGSEEIEE